MNFQLKYVLFNKLNVSLNATATKKLEKKVFVLSVQKKYSKQNITDILTREPFDTKFQIWVTSKDSQIRTTRRYTESYNPVLGMFSLQDAFFQLSGDQ